MRFDEYQTKASTTAIYMNKVVEKYGDKIPEEIYKVLSISYCALGMGESGEVQEKIKSIIEQGGIIDSDDKKEIVGEMGDQLWYISAMCNVFNLQMSSIANGFIDFDLFQKNVKDIDLFQKNVKDISFSTNIVSSSIIHLIKISCCALGMGESGQVQGKVKKIIRDAGGDIKRSVEESILQSMTFQLEWVARMCSLLGISMSEVAEENIAKLFSRKERGVIGGSGDNR